MLQVSIKLTNFFDFSLKMHLYEMSKSRHFALVWSCLRGVQSVGVGLGVPIFGLLFDNLVFGQIFGAIFIFSATCLLLAGDRCRQYRRSRKCPYHHGDSDQAVDKMLNPDNDNIILSKSGNQGTGRKSSEDMFRSYFGEKRENIFRLN